MPSWQMLASIFLVIKMSFSTCMLCVRCCAVAIIGSAIVRLVKIKSIRLNIKYICSFCQFMCHLWMNVLLLDECGIYGQMCHLWMNVPFMDECATFG